MRSPSPPRPTSGLRRPLGHVLLFAALLASAATAHADARSDAEEAMKSGAGFFKQKKYAKAIESYKKAVAAFPEAPGPYREIGKCYVELDKPQEAIESFSEYLSRRPDAPERDDIEASFDELREKLKKGGQALLSIDSDPAGAVVFVVDEAGRQRGIGVTPLTAHPIPPSATAVRIVKPYYEPEEKPLKLKPDTSAELTLKLLPAGSRVDVVAPKEPPSGMVFLGVGGGAALGATAFGIAFLADRAAFKDVPIDDPDLVAKQRTQRLLANASDGLLVVAVIAGAIGVPRYLKHRKFRRESGGAALRLSPTPGGLALSGEF
jgi:tetratricopeptide (TPR) repeat protein